MEGTTPQKRKRFNTAGLCIPQYHYMADVRDKVNCIIEKYIDRDEYFTINRARQYGKTTILYLLKEALKDRCVVLSMSFEGKEEYFTSLKNFAEGLNISLYKALKAEHPKLYERSGYDQLVRYLEARGVKKGYMLSFCDNKETPHKDRTFVHYGFEICEVIVAYRDV